MRHFVFRIVNIKLSNKILSEIALEQMEQFEGDRARGSWSPSNHSQSDSQGSKEDSGLESSPLQRSRVTVNTQGPGEGTDHHTWVVSRVDVSN